MPDSVLFVRVLPRWAAFLTVPSLRPVVASPHGRRRRRRRLSPPRLRGRPRPGLWPDREAIISGARAAGEAEGVQALQCWGMNYINTHYFFCY